MEEAIYQQHEPYEGWLDRSGRRPIVRLQRAAHLCALISKYTDRRLRVVFIVRERTSNGLQV